MRIRYFVQASFLAFLLFAAARHQKVGGGPTGAPSVDAFCPFGGLESLYSLMASGQYIQRIEPSSLVLLGAITVSVVFARRGFCGWICPFGTIQEWIKKVVRKIKAFNFDIDSRLDPRIRYSKYILFAIILGASWYTQRLVFHDYDPYVTFMHFGKGLLWNFGDEPLKIMPFAILGAVLVGSVFIERFWCKYACPLGVYTQMANRFTLLKIRRTEECIDCKKCDSICPTGVQVSTNPEVKSSECITCMDCVDKCPTKALEIHMG